jgi:hypothetical protein
MGQPDRFSAVFRTDFPIGEMGRRNGSAKWVAKWVSLNRAISYRAKQIAQFRLTRFLDAFSAF